MLNKKVPDQMTSNREPQANAKQGERRRKPMVGLRFTPEIENRLRENRWPDELLKQMDEDGAALAYGWSRPLREEFGQLSTFLAYFKTLKENPDY